jgi:hypothetical protein
MKFVWLLFLATAAFAHDHGQPELNAWYADLKNSQGTPCCDGSEAMHIDDVDWQTVCEKGTGECHYQVFIEGRWWNVPDSAVVKGANRSQRAIVWPIRYGMGDGKPPDYAIRCFMPGAGT